MCGFVAWGLLSLTLPYGVGFFPEVGLPLFLNLHWLCECAACIIIIIIIIVQRMASECAACVAFYVAAQYIFFSVMLNGDLIGMGCLI